MEKEKLKMLLKLRVLRYMSGHKNAGGVLYYLFKKIREDIVILFKKEIAENPKNSLYNVVTELERKYIKPMTDTEIIEIAARGMVRKMVRK